MGRVCPNKGNGPLSRASASSSTSSFARITLLRRTLSEPGRLPCVRQVRQQPWSRGRSAQRTIPPIGHTRPSLLIKVRFGSCQNYKNDSTYTQHGKRIAPHLNTYLTASFPRKALKKNSVSRFHAITFATIGEWRATVSEAKYILVVTSDVVQRMRSCTTCEFVVVLAFLLRLISGFPLSARPTLQIPIQKIRPA